MDNKQNAATEVAEKQQEEILFFVYGTLKAGYYNNRLLKKAEFLGTHATEPVYTLFDGGFPIVERGGKTSVKGEVWKATDDETIFDVFRLEGCKREQNAPGSWYTYDKIDTPYGEAHIFVMDEGKGGRNTIINTGVWGR